MKTTYDGDRRATRLLRWYPPAWRERYGEEFVAHLEQEFADRPTDFRRSVNIVFKGLVARVGDLGFSNASVSAGSQARAALGTGFALIALMVVIMLDFWSRAMLAWSGRRYHPIPVSATTGVLTVAMGLLLLVLAAIVLFTVVCAVRQIVHGRGRRLAGPSILAAGAGGVLIYVARLFPTMLGQYISGAHGFKGIRLSHPGQVIVALAQIAWELTQRWMAAWNQGGFPGTSTAQTVLDDCVPFLMLAFGVAIALLIRRVEFPRAGARLALPTVETLSALTGVFFVTYLAWSAFGGPSNYEYFFPETRWLGYVYLILLAVVPMVIGGSGLLSRRLQPRQGRNRIEIIS
ncbi:MAG: hypothetical protein WA614_05940 [Acidimicrobiales bacterium]